MACASEGLKFLDERKDFWQQQKPVYARKAELMPANAQNGSINGDSIIKKNIMKATMNKNSFSAKVKWIMIYSELISMLNMIVQSFIHHNTSEYTTLKYTDDIWALYVSWKLLYLLLPYLKVTGQLTEWWFYTNV